MMFVERIFRTALSRAAKNAFLNVGIAASLSVSGTLFLSSLAQAQIQTQTQTPADAPAVKVQTRKKDRRQLTPGQAIYQRVESMVFKVKTAIDANSPKASYGTGFAVSPNGLLITNYHVISDAVINPRLSKIFLVLETESVSAQILGIDVLRDLALIKVDTKFSKWLSFADTPPHQGEPLYSIGEPQDLNMAIVAGTFNGELSYGAYSVMHLSSPINSGMSGGPTLNGRSEIVGINVSKNSASDSLSFAVPSRFARGLIARSQHRAPPTAQQHIEEIGSQLLSVQEDLTLGFLKSADRKPQMLGPWSFPQPASILKCWSQKEEDDESHKYEALRQRCHLPHASYIDSRLQTGTYSIGLDAVNGRMLKALPFYTLLNSRFGEDADVEDYFVSADSGPMQLTRRYCFSDIIFNSIGLMFKMAYCTRGYVKFPDLRDATILIATLAPPPHGLLIDIELEGFTTPNIKKIVDRSLNSIRMQSK